MPTIKVRRGTAAQWTSSNPVLAAGEPGHELDTGKLKVGNGTSTWSELPYFIQEDKVAELITAAVNAHVTDATPHDAYDDGASFVVAYTNAKA